MRYNLAQYVGKKRTRFYGTVQFNRRRQDRVCIQHIHDEDGNYVAQHAGLINERLPDWTTMRPGDVLVFDALVKKYLRDKSYVWTVEDEKIEEDYGFYDLKSKKAFTRESIRHQRDEADDYTKLRDLMVKDMKQTIRS